MSSSTVTGWVRSSRPPPRGAFRGFVAGTAPLRSVQVVKNNEVAHEQGPRGADLEFEIEDPGAADATEDFYYLKVVQEDGELAWSSPIWVGP